MLPAFSSSLIHEAWLDCRRRKRGTKSALRFELGLGRNLLELEDELGSGAWMPSRSVCFITRKPKPREIFAADFRDRIVHHLLVRRIEPYWEKVFIYDSYASRKGKGTHAAVERLSSFLRRATRGGRRRAWFLKIDVENFFMSIDRSLLLSMVKRGLRRQLGVPDDRLPLCCGGLEEYRQLSHLAEKIIMNDPARGCTRMCPPGEWFLLPAQKSLFSCGEGVGLPIGNLTSQFFANVYLNELDQFAKHVLKARFYVRYVDDAVLVHPDRQVLDDWLGKIASFLLDRLRLRLNQGAIELKPVSCGINFLGYIVHPAYRLARRRVAGNFARKLERFERLLVSREPGGAVRYDYESARLEMLLATVNSYLAQFRRASSRSLLSRILARHRWIERYLSISDFKAARAWKPPRDFPCLRAQYYWFRRNWPEAVVFFQIGSYIELYGDDAGWAAGALGLHQIEPRFGKALRAGFPAGMAGRFVRLALEAGRPVLEVSETGYPLLRLRERHPRALWLPRFFAAPG